MISGQFKGESAFSLMMRLSYAGLILSLVSFSLLAKYLPQTAGASHTSSSAVSAFSASLVIYFTLREPEPGKTAFCIESLYSITRVAISSVLLPDVRTVGFAMSRVSDSFGSIIAGLIYALVVAVSGIGNTVLYLSLGGGILALVQYTAYYFTVPADAEKMQETLRGMGK